MSSAPSTGTDPLLSAPVRPDYSTLPTAVRAAVDTRLGSPVVRAITVRGGFSQAVAARLVTADGDRVFVKAVGADTSTGELHRREAAVTASLPPGAPTSRLLDCLEVAGSVVLLLADVDGSMPRHPWRNADLAAAHATLDLLDDVLTPNPFPGARPVLEELAPDLAAWSRIAADPAARAALPRWSARHLDRLVALCTSPAAGSLAGERLLHLDTRADNLLLGAGSPTGAVLVDWPWAAVGAPWVDRVVLALDVGVGGGDAAAALACPAADPAGLTVLLAALAGMWTEAVERPAGPGMPTLRAFQRAELDVTLRWLRDLTGWG